MAAQSVDRNKNNISIVQSSYEEALHIYEELVSVNPQAYSSDLGAKHVNVATFTKNR